MEVKDARLFFNNTTKLSTELYTVAAVYPEDFLDYLRIAWERDGDNAQKIPSVMTELKNIRVLCEDEKRWPLSQTYLPTRELLFHRGKYMMQDEDFPFLKLQEPLTREGPGNLWAFLESHFDVGAQESLDFYLDILKFIHRNRSGESLEIPRRILQLYLQINATCGTSDNQVEARQKVRESFEEHVLVQLSPTGWMKPSTCILERSFRGHSFSSPIGRIPLLPLQRNWKATDAEREEVIQFFQNTLMIPNEYSWQLILENLDEIRKNVGSRAASSYEMMILDDSYTCLSKMIPHLSDDEEKNLRSSFTNTAYIASKQHDSLQWHKQSDCVWAPGVNIPGLVDLSGQYERLELFFTKFLGVTKHAFGSVYKDLVSSNPAHISPEAVKQKLLSLNASLLEYGDLLDLGQLLSSAIFPVRNANGQINLVSESAEFYIADRKLLRKKFSDKLPLLDFTPYEIWVLEPFMVWSGLETRYLSWNVEEISFLEDATPVLMTQGFATARVCGFLRIAIHFRSPRVRTSAQRQSFLRKLDNALFFRTDGIKLQLKVGTVMTKKLIGQLHIEEDDDDLRIYVPDEQEAQEFCSLSLLPRRLVVWMMTDFDTNFTERVNEVAVNLAQTIIRAPEALVDRVLDEAGIVTSDDTDSSINVELKAPSPGPSKLEHNLRQAQTRGVKAQTKGDQSQASGYTSISASVSPDEEVVHKLEKVTI